MIFSKQRSLAGTTIALALALACGWSFDVRPAASQDAEQQQAPAQEEQAAPEQTAPQEAAPADGTVAEPAQEAPQSEGEPAAGAADSAPAEPEQPAAEAPAAPAEGGTAITASQVQIGAAVFGSDGAQIGEVNGVKADDSGNVQEILVTNGTPAGINAKVFEIPADKITSVGDGVKLSLSSEEAKQLPIIDNSSG